MSDRPKRVLVINAGSHSLKLDLLDGEDQVVAERDVDAAPDGDEAKAALRELLREIGSGVDAVGHRIVHGGAELTDHALVDDEVLRKLRAAADLAPLHVPPALAAMATVREALPDVPHVACLDTVFHRTLPEPARTYAVPQRWRSEFGVRRYGFHGLSYAWILRRSAELLGRPAHELNLVMTHLGGGASVCAVEGGRSVWTSMGFTPLEGLVMVSRSGTVDPGMLTWLQTSKGLSAQEVSDALEHHSGLEALSGGTGDTRKLYPAAESGDAAATLALDVFTLRLRQEIAAAAVCLPRLDGVVFSGEIGADQPEVREAVCAGLGLLGLTAGLSTAQEDDGVISPDGAKVPVLLVHPHEDREMAFEVRRVVSG
jgi:acetate kinase